MVAPKKMYTSSMVIATEIGRLNSSSISKAERFGVPETFALTS